jgi:hypothetical protein
MLNNILPLVVSVLTGVVVPTFDYLKYRAYTNTVRHVVDKLGVDGLEKLGVTVPPASLARRSTFQTEQKRD